MPRWKDLPEDLDPQIKEFTSQLRRLVDRSGLSIAALADRTGYSKTSWERYLSGRLLAPKGAIVALSEVTGSSPVHLTTMWELAERAWSRAEMRHDRTMEAIRISQARAALGDFGAAEATGGPSAGQGGGTAVTPGVAGPAGVSPAVPVRPAAPDAGGDAREDAGGEPADAADGADGADSGVNSWKLAGYRGPSPTSGRPGTGIRPPAPADGPGPAPGTPAPGTQAPGTQAPGTPPPGIPVPGIPVPHQGQPGAPRPADRASAGGPGRRQRLTMFLAGLVGVLVVVAGVLWFVNQGGHGGKGGAAKSPAPSASAHVKLPPGVKCAGSACDGKDAEAMGCSGDLVTTAKTATVGTTTLEVRYSKSCGTVWGRITGATQGDEVQVSSGKVKQTGEITAVGDAIAYTPMVAVKNPAEAKACATLASGRTGCTP
ncbi:DUF2690 domain-containing protein [Streptomyces sp900105245]|uniref:DUF2690 domain-containing protein n=1 Tax=Streptomyces sp. 900105245 TaxID=3154379 RepID=A0ABV1UHP0_9ACTN